MNRIVKEYLFSNNLFVFYLIDLFFYRKAIEFAKKITIFNNKGERKLKFLIENFQKTTNVTHFLFIYLISKSPIGYPNEMLPDGPISFKYDYVM